MLRFLALISSLLPALTGGVANAQTAGDIVAHWRDIAPVCASYPAKAGCDDGDMMLFSGLLCATGEQLACQMVRDSQSEDGRWWRSPRRVDGNLGERHSFSRDMSLGVMLYLVATHDAEAARRWVRWIEANRACAVESPFGGCAVWGPYRYCRDDDAGSCSLMPANWALLGRVFDELGLPQNMQMRVANGIDSETMLAEAATAPVGFQLHLVGVEIFLKLLIGATDADRQTAANRLIARQPNNPFFKFLSGRDPSWWQQTLEICPHPGDAPGSRLNQWSWERDTEEAAWSASMGWDCLFLANLNERRDALVRRD